MVSRSEPFLAFFSRLAPYFELPRTARLVLERLLEPDAGAAAVAGALERNQFLAEAFVREVKALGGGREVAGVKAAVSLYGLSRTRDFVCALELSRAHAGRPPDKSGIRPADLLKRALKAEAAAGAREPELAFVAGLAFDVLSIMGRERFGAPEGFERLVDETFARSLAAAQSAAAASKKPASGYGRYLFAARLLRELGALALELLNPAGTPAPYGVFRAVTAERGLTPFVSRLAERARYGVGQEQLGAQLVARLPGLAPIEKAVLFQHEPYLLKASEPDLSQFAATIT